MDWEQPLPPGLGQETKDGMNMGGAPLPPELKSKPCWRGYSHDSLRSEVIEVPASKICWQIPSGCFEKMPLKKRCTLPATVPYKSLLQEKHPFPPVPSTDEA